jgi:transcriptional regulator with XRE-family HTH domain
VAKPALIGPTSLPAAVVDLAHLLLLRVKLGTRIAYSQGMPKVRAPRKVVVVDNSALARSIGGRIRKARLAAGMTQAELAHGRYTSAYVSALERGLAKPSMAALQYVGDRLGQPPRAFLEPDTGAATRMEADLRLASGAWREAVDAYRELADRAADRRSRAEARRGEAEALMRLDRSREAIAPAAEAVDVFTSLGQPADAAYASYWLAYAHARSENLREARLILESALQQVRAGLSVTPDFRFRLLNGLANVEALDGQHATALTYLEEARGSAGDLDLRRRASFLAGLSLSYREVGDLEASIVSGNQSLALFRAQDALLEGASLANNMALTYMQLGNLRKAAALASEARSTAERLGDDAMAAHFMETQAQVALARADLEAAGRFAEEASQTAERVGEAAVAASVQVTLSRIAEAKDDLPAAIEHMSSAVALLRDLGVTGRLRQVLGDLADLYTKSGALKQATVAYQEALSLR